MPFIQCCLDALTFCVTLPVFYVLDLKFLLHSEAKLFYGRHLLFCKEEYISGISVFFYLQKTILNTRIQFLFGWKHL